MYVYTHTHIYINVVTTALIPVCSQLLHKIITDYFPVQL